MLLEGRTQAEVAESLRVSRATVSVSYQRAGLRSISRLLGAVRHVFAEGAQVAQPPGTVVP
jgi:DNA-binding CsgD family transcriptional regulator